MGETTSGERTLELPPGDVSSTIASGSQKAMPWLSRNLRNIIALALTALVCYLASRGHEQAQTALITTFISLVSYVFGERAGLKRPGVDA